MNTTNLKFFTGCAAGLALLCSITLCGCSGAENDISALECFAGSCEGEDEENNDDKDHGDNHENNQDFNGNNSNNGRYTNHEDCDDHGLVEDFNCNSSRVGKTLFEENFNMIFVCEETVNGATWEIHPEFSNCSDYKANNSGKESGGSSESNGNSSSSAGSSNSQCGNLWCGPDHDERVNTDFDDGSKTSGIWNIFGDYEIGGTSEISLMEDKKICPGICGDVLLDNSSYSTPYAGFYFNLVNEKRDGANISSWGGICMTSKIHIETTIELVHQQGDIIAPFVVHFEPTETSANISWNNFVQEQKEGLISLERDEFLSQVAAIKIYWTSSQTLSIPFEITSIGTYGSCP